jgi:hypothetical protein
MDINQQVEGLINAVTAAKMKGFRRSDGFMYHVNNKPGTPQPVIIDGIRFWQRAEIEAWEPTLDKRGPKTTNRKEE